MTASTACRVWVSAALGMSVSACNGGSNGGEFGSVSQEGGTGHGSSSSGGETTGAGSLSTTAAETSPGSSGGVDASTGGTSGGTTAGTTGGETTTGGGAETTTGGGTTGGIQACAPVPPGGEDCLAPANHLVCDDDQDTFHALGLDCAGDESNSTPIANAVFMASDADTWHVITQFGQDNEWQPKEGNAMLILSTGNLDDPTNGGVLTQSAGVTENLMLGMNRNKTSNPDNQQLPEPIHPVDGSGGTPFVDCDCVDDCSDTLQSQWELGDSSANDLLWFSFDLSVPQGTYGYEFDFAFFSAEYPEWVDTQYNDVFVVWSTSETYTGNITFIDDQPLTVTALQNNMQYGENSPVLDGTGFDGVGGGTGWFTAEGSVAPYESFTLAWAIFDMGDEVLDTAVLLDNFRWSCMGCAQPGCGIVPQ